MEKPNLAWGPTPGSSPQSRLLLCGCAFQQMVTMEGERTWGNWCAQVSEALIWPDFHCIPSAVPIAKTTGKRGLTAQEEESCALCWDSNLSHVSTSCLVFLSSKSGVWTFLPSKSSIHLCIDLPKLPLKVFSRAEHGKWCYLNLHPHTLSMQDPEGGVLFHLQFSWLLTFLETFLRSSLRDGYLLLQPGSQCSHHPGVMHCSIWSPGLNIWWVWAGVLCSC